MNKYNDLLKKIELVINKDLPLVSNLSNVSAILNEMGDINWCGFYIVKDDYLYLGPFQGEVACTIIKKGNGVCGTSFLNKETMIVEDVDKFPGHIRCSNASKSEIVTPIIKDNEVKAVIDIDAPVLSRFTLTEKDFLEKVSNVLKGLTW